MSIRTILRRAFASLFVLLASASAHAQLFRAYLASDGNDAHPCTLAQPCRLLPAALAAVANDGEIWMLDSANYNTASVTIDKSVSILAVPGAVGSVVAIGGPAISIAAAGLTVALRNLVILEIAGGATMSSGVVVTGTSTLIIDRSLIANLSFEGVSVSGLGKVRIVDTIIRNNGGYGVALSGGATGSISGTKLLGNLAGGVAAHSLVAATTKASVSDSVISGGDVGVMAYSNIAGGAARVFVTRCMIEGTTSALDSDSGVGSALVTVSYTMVTRNNYAWTQAGAGGVIKTLGNNHIADNTTTFGSLTSTPLQ